MIMAIWVGRLVFFKAFSRFCIDSFSKNSSVLMNRFHICNGLGADLERTAELFKIPPSPFSVPVRTPSYNETILFGELFI